MRYRSPKQQAASRANGSRSQGPVTPEGKRISAQNSQKHGLFAKAILLPGESEAEFHRMSTQLHDRFVPTDALEIMLVQRMILAQWRLVRVWAFELAGMLQQQPDSPESAPDSTHPAFRDLAAFHNLHGRGRSGSLLQLSELRYQRQFDRAIAQLEHLRRSAKYEIEETNPVSDSKDYLIPQNTEPADIPNRPASNPKRSQTDLPPTQNEPEDEVSLQ